MVNLKKQLNFLILIPIYKKHNVSAADFPGDCSSIVPPAVKLYEKEIYTVYIIKCLGLGAGMKRHREERSRTIISKKMYLRVLAKTNRLHEGRFIAVFRNTSDERRFPQTKS